MPNPNINIVIFTGNLTTDPELKQTQTGKSVVSFTIGINKFTAGRKTTLFMKCHAWEKKAEFLAKWFKKGSPVYVIGSLEDRPWKGPDGKTNHQFEVECTDIQFCSNKNDTPTSDTPAASHDNIDYRFPAADVAFEDVPMTDELPF